MSRSHCRISGIVPKYEIQYFKLCDTITQEKNGVLSKYSSEKSPEILICCIPLHICRDRKYQRVSIPDRTMNMVQVCTVQPILSKIRSPVKNIRGVKKPVEMSISISGYKQAPKSVDIIIDIGCLNIST